MATYVGIELRNTGKVAYSIIAQVGAKGEMVGGMEGVDLADVPRALRARGIPLNDCVLCVPPDQARAIKSLLRLGEWRPQVNVAGQSQNRSQRRRMGYLNRQATP